MNPVGLRRLFIDWLVNPRTFSACIATKHQGRAVVGAADNFRAMAAAFRTDGRMGLSGGLRRIIMNHNVI